ncbi:glycoside hydrolase family 28 protein [Pseudolactococcus yaeyamensis]
MTLSKSVFRINESDSIETALDTIKSEGGGHLILSKGQYKTSGISLCSNLTLELESGSVLTFTDDPNDYPPIWTRWEGVECFAMKPLIYADDVENVAIIGSGIIDGNGRKWWEMFADIESENRTQPREAYELRLAALNPDYGSRTGGGARPSTQFLRPPLIQFWKSQNIKIQGVTIQNSPFWTLHTVYSQEISIDQVTIYNPHDAINTDAIDIDSCRNVRITNSIFDVGDDAITLKSGSGADGLRINRPTEEVQVNNCKILASHGGIAIGSETAGGIKNVMVTDCEFQGTQRGIRLKSRRGRGGIIENIHLKNLVMTGCWCPIVLGMYFAPGVLPHERKVILNPEMEQKTATTPSIRNIIIDNLQADQVRSTAAFIVGLPESKIENVDITNFSWSLAAEEELLDTSNTEPTEGLFHDNDRGIKTINVSHLTINGVEIKTCS